MLLICVKQSELHRSTGKSWREISQQWTRNQKSVDADEINVAATERRWKVERTLRKKENTVAPSTHV